MLLINIPPLELHCFFVPRKDFATGHWTLACCLILLLHIILICCSTSYSHNRGGFYISPIFCIDLDFSGTVKHQSESQNSRSGVSENQRDCQSPKERLQWQPTIANVTNCQNRQNQITDGRQLHLSYPSVPSTPSFLYLAKNPCPLSVHVRVCVKQDNLRVQA